MQGPGRNDVSVTALLFALLDSCSRFPVPYSFSSLDDGDNHRHTWALCPRLICSVSIKIQTDYGERMEQSLSRAGNDVTCDAGIRAAFSGAANLDW